jgi:hypothetical protein
MRGLKCEACGEGFLRLDMMASVVELSPQATLTYEQMAEFIDKYMAAYMVFTCPFCGESFRYTEKEILGKYSETIKEYLFQQIVPNKVTDYIGAGMTKVLVYCGKCAGQDGKGSCAVEVLTKCDIKEFPVE